MRVEMKRAIAAVVVAFVFVVQPLCAAEPAKPEVQRAIAYLKQEQGHDGAWADMIGFRGGVTALATLALLESGVPAADPVVQKALANLRSLGEPDRTYSTALIMMVFEAAEPDKDRAILQRDAAWLTTNQLKTDPINGAWGYGIARGNADNSNTRFALLGLQAAEQAGVPIDEAVWRRSLDYWLDSQNPDGSWGYVSGAPGTGSMTCSGIASVVVCARHFEANAKLTAAKAEAVARGIRWLSKHFSIKNNPNPQGLEMPWLLYYLDSLEDAARLTNERQLDQHDWFREASSVVLAGQDRASGAWTSIAGNGNPLIATSLAMLFLSGKSVPQPPPPAAP